MRPKNKHLHFVDNIEELWKVFLLCSVKVLFCRRKKVRWIVLQEINFEVSPIKRATNKGNPPIKPWLIFGHHGDSNTSFLYLLLDFHHLLKQTFAIYIMYAYSKIQSQDLDAHLKHSLLLNQVGQQGIKEPLLCYHGSSLFLLSHFWQNNAHANHHLYDGLQLGVQHRPHLTSVWAASNKILQEVVLRVIVWSGNRSEKSTQFEIFWRFCATCSCSFPHRGKKIWRIDLKKVKLEEVASNEFPVDFCSR